MYPHFDWSKPPPKSMITVQKLGKMNKLFAKLSSFEKVALSASRQISPGNGANYLNSLFEVAVNLWLSVGTCTAGRSAITSAKHIKHFSVKLT